MPIINGPHEYRLDERQRSDGVVARGEVEGIHRRLSDGHPITILAVGASVAVQAGCIDQPGAECMKYSGREYVDLGWGRGGKHAGFLVQWVSPPSDPRPPFFAPSAQQMMKAAALMRSNLINSVPLDQQDVATPGSSADQ